MVEPAVLAACTLEIGQASKADLRDDSAELAGRGRDTVGSRTVASREDLAGNDERSRVGAEVLEEVGKAVEEDERLLGGVAALQSAVAEAWGTKLDTSRCRKKVRLTHDDEERREHGEAHQLDRLAAPGVDQKESSPVARNQTTNGKNDVTDGSLAQDLVPVQAGALGSA